MITRNIYKFLNRKVIIRTLCFAVIAFLLYSFIHAFNGVWTDKAEYEQIQKLRDPRLQMRGLSLYLDDEEIYRFIRVSGGGMFMQDYNTIGLRKDSILTRYETINGFILGEIPVPSQLYEYVMTGKNNIEPESIAWHILPKVQNGISKKEWMSFIDLLNKKTGHKFRLPSIDEWQYAARGGQASKGYLYAGSNNIDEVAVYYGNYNKDVGLRCKSKKPNELGFYDMTGLVDELTSTPFLEKAPEFKHIPEFDTLNIVAGGPYDTVDLSFFRLYMTRSTGDYTGARLILVE